MSGVVKALNWDDGYEQQFIVVNPLCDEVILYQTLHKDPNVETNDLVRVQSRSKFDNIQCMSYANNYKGLISVGQINGNVCVFDINTPTSLIVRLKPKQSRPCNCVSFNGQGLVAGGFDKGRQDNSLQIWNIEHYSKSSNNDHIKRPTFSYIPNEAVLSSGFYPDSAFNLLCGSYKYLREIDVRTDQPVFQMATKCTLGIQVDPFQHHYFMSYGEDGSLALWDRRKLAGNKHSILTESPVLQFNKLLDNSTKGNLCLRYSTIRRGEFSAVFNGDLIRRWHTGVVPSTTTSIPKRSVGNDLQTLQSLNHQASQLYKPNEDSLFVSLVLDAKTDFSRIMSYDYCCDLESATSTNFVCMRQSGSVFKMPVVECIESLDFNSFNEFSFTGPEGTMTQFSDDWDDYQILQNNNLLNRINDFSLSNKDLNNLAKNDYDLESLVHNEDNAIEDDEAEEDSLALDTFLDISQVLNNDICCTIRKRAKLGYGHDCEKNIRVLESIDNIDNQLALRNTWKWLSLAKKSLDKGTMVNQGIDLGFLGVHGIWNGLEKLTNPNRFSKDIGTLSDQFFANTIKSIVSSKGKKAAAINIPSNSDCKAQRKLCLIVSGWYFSDQEFDERLNILINLGFVEKAAGWAVFHGNVNKAIEILASSSSERLRLMATAVAGYLAYKNSNINSPWKDQCRRMASELDDPYLRAIFAFIADNDWWDVLDEHSLPLRERLGVALRFLLDKDLTVYLNRISDSVVAKGELEGLTLTGITSKGIDLLQNYVDRTSDVQTAALIASFGSPRYLNDARVDHWVDCYRDLLNSWGAFNIRAKFDVNRTKLSKTRTGNITLKAIQKQVYLQCPKCNKNIFKTQSKNLNNKNPQVLFKQLQNKEQTLKSCMNCGAQLPRCAVCLLSLGSPVPYDEEKDSSIIEKKFREWFSFCLNCNHGCHAYHAEEWFSKHYVCPIPDCNCKCNSL